MIRRITGFGLAGAATALAAVVAASALLPAAAATGRAAASQAAVSPPACAAGALAVSVAADHIQGAAGTLFIPIEFTNFSQQTCTLFGFPGVSAVTFAGKQLGSPAAWAGGQPGTVTLAPGGTGHAILRYSNVITGNCPTADKRTAYELKVFPPGQTQADHALWPFIACTAPGSSVFMTVQFTAPGFGF